MATLVFDIETVGMPWEEFDAPTKKVLTRHIRQQSKDDDEFKRALETMKTQLSLSPLTGEIAALGMYDIERRLGAVYYQGNTSKVSETEGEFTFKERTEKELLEDFWEGARSYDTFVTFNGRCFDVPFLLHRSVVCGVKPSLSLVGQRYVTKQTMPYHVDLMDELTFYGVMQKRPSLHLFCQAYGIETPKGEVDGYDVAELFRMKKFRDIARYSANDVTATAALYEKWKRYLAPASFINAIEF